MEWRLNALTVIARGIVMTLIIIAGASIVHNVTAALLAVTAVCEKAIAHLV